MKSAISLFLASLAASPVLGRVCHPPSATSTSTTITSSQTVSATSLPSTTTVQSPPLSLTTTDKGADISVSADASVSYNATTTVYTTEYTTVQLPNPTSSSISANFITTIYTTEYTTIDLPSSTSTTSATPSPTPSCQSGTYTDSIGVRYTLTCDSTLLPDPNLYQRVTGLTSLDECMTHCDGAGAATGFNCLYITWYTAAYNSTNTGAIEPDTCFLFKDAAETYSTFDGAVAAKKWPVM